MADNNKIYETFVEVSADLTKLKADFDKMASYFKNSSRGIKLQFDDALAKKKLSELPALYEKLKQRLEKKIKMDADVGSIQIVKDKLASVERAMGVIEEKSDDTATKLSKWGMIATGINQTFEFTKSIFGSINTFAQEVTQKAVDLEVLRANFKGSAEDIQLFQKATAGTVTEANLIKLSNQATDLGISLDKQAILFALAEDAADKYGTSVEEGMMKVIYASEGSNKGLKSLGIQTAEYKKIVENLTASTGKKIEELDAEEQKQIRLEAIIKASGITLQDVASKTKDNADKIGALGVRVEEAKTRVGGFIASALVPLAEELSESSTAGGVAADTILALGSTAMQVIPVLVQLKVAHSTQAAAAAASATATTTSTAAISASRWVMMGTIGTVAALVAGYIALKQAMDAYKEAKRQETRNTQLTAEQETINNKKTPKELEDFKNEKLDIIKSAEKRKADNEKLKTSSVTKEKRKDKEGYEYTTEYENDKTKLLGSVIRADEDLIHVSKEAIKYADQRINQLKEEAKLKGSIKETDKQAFNYNLEKQKLLTQTISEQFERQKQEARDAYSEDVVRYKELLNKKEITKEQFDNLEEARKAVLGSKLIEIDKQVADNAKSEKLKAVQTLIKAFELEESLALKSLELQDATDAEKLNKTNEYLQKKLDLVKRELGAESEEYLVLQNELEKNKIGVKIFEEKELDKKDKTKIEAIRKYYEDMGFVAEDYYKFRMELIKEEEQANIEKGLTDVQAHAFALEQKKQLDQEYSDFVKEQNVEWANIMSAVYTQALSTIEIKTASTATRIEKIFIDLANTIIGELKRIAAQKLVNSIFDVVSTVVSFGTNSIGGVAKGAMQGSGIIPSSVSGPSGNINIGDAINKVNSSIQAMNMNMISLSQDKTQVQVINNAPDINTRVIVQKKTENKLKKNGVNYV